MSFSVVSSARGVARWVAPVEEVRKIVDPVVLFRSSILTFNKVIQVCHALCSPQLFHSFGCLFSSIAMHCSPLTVAFLLFPYDSLRLGDFLFAKMLDVNKS